MALLRSPASLPVQTIAAQNSQRNLEPSEPARINRAKAIEVPELEQFLDRFFAERMQSQHIPELAIAIVRDGKLFFSKG